MSRLDDLEGRARTVRDQSEADLWLLVAEAADVLKGLDPPRRRMWLASVLNEMWDEQIGKCALCGEGMDFGVWDVDHRIPFCYGGGNERANLQLAHPACNRRRRTAVDPRDLLRYLEDRYMNLR